MVKTKIFTDEDVEMAVDEFVEFCDVNDLDGDDIIDIQIIARSADRETTVVLIYDDAD